MPGRKISPKAVAAAGEAAAKSNPSKVKNASSPAGPPAAMSQVKPHSKQGNKNSAPPKKEVQYVEYVVGAEKPKAAPRKVKNDLSTLNVSLKDSAVAKSKKGKNVKQLSAPKKQPTLPHHHGGKAPAEAAARSE